MKGLYQFPVMTFSKQMVMNGDEQGQTELQTDPHDQPRYSVVVGKVHAKQGSGS